MLCNTRWPCQVFELSKLEQKGLWFCFCYYYLFSKKKIITSLNHSPPLPTRQTNKKKKQTKPKPTNETKHLHKRAIHASFSLWSQCPLVQYEGESPRGRSYTDITWEEYVLPIIMWSNYFSAVKEEPLQVILLSRDNLGFSSATYGDCTPLQYPKRVLIPCISKYWAQGYLSNILRHF